VKKVLIVTVLIIVFLVLFVVKNKSIPMKITSSAFENNTKIPIKYTCDGQGINPPLSFADIPVDAKSLALIVDDPDAPGGTWAHWVVFNIDPKINGVSENSLPKGGIEGMTSFGRVGYGGACPPPASPEQLQRGESGTHRYFFKLYSLDTILNLTNPDKAALEKAMQGHIPEKAELIGLYSKI
jgi:Raf kinase inhibitor-like YbhB/YbcL family protein